MKQHYYCSCVFSTKPYIAKKMSAGVLLIENQRDETTDFFFFFRLKTYGECNSNPMEVYSHMGPGLIYRTYSVAALQILYSFFMVNGHMLLLHFKTMWAPSGG